LETRLRRGGSGPPGRRRRARVPATRSLTALLVGLLALGAASACGGSGDESAGDPSTDKLAQIQARGTLVGFFEPDYPPQSIANEDGTRPADTPCDDNQLTGAEVTGFDIEVTKLVASALEVEPCFVSPPWQEVAGGNWGDRWDVAYGSGAITADRMERLTMTQPYYTIPSRYFVRTDSAFQTPRDLERKKIGVCVSCSQEAFLRGDLVIPGTSIEPGPAEPEIVVFEVETPGLAALEKGTVDAFLTGDPVGRARIDEGSPLRALDAIAFTEYLSGFVDRSSGLETAPFVEKVNEIIRGLHEDGTLRELSVEWFGQDYASGAADFDLASLEQEVE
jgi:polar amino acid transport system substrate-binding protein